jgi:hypothetical protein
MVVPPIQSDALFDHSLKKTSTPNTLDQNQQLSNQLISAAFLSPDFSCRSQRGSHHTFAHEKFGLELLENFALFELEIFLSDQPGSDHLFELLELDHGILSVAFLGRGLGDRLDSAPFFGEERLEFEFGWDGRWIFGSFGKEIGRVGEIQDGEINAVVGRSGGGNLKLLSDLADRAHGIVFDGTDADLGVEDDDEETMLIDVAHEQAVILALLIDVREVGFSDETGDALGGGIGGGSESAEGGGIKGPAIAGFADDKASFIEDKRGGRLAFLKEVIESGRQGANVVFDELGQRSHG